jgi:Na+-transporting NADH:ubiquinone oxidoreductase subunit B
MKFLRNFLDSVEPHFINDGKLKKIYALYEMIDTFLYTPSDNTTSGPHVRDAIDLKRSMVIVVIALLPAFFFGTYNVGLQEALHATGVTFQNINLDFLTHFLIGLKTVLPIYAVVFTVGGIWEVIFAVSRGHEINEGFLVTGFLIPLVLPPAIPLWMVGVATTFGVVIGKEIFGGTGFNIFNPALVARAFLFFAYPGAMSGDKVWTVDAMSGATPLLEVSSQEGMSATALLSGHFTWVQMFYGFIPGSIGETSTIAILIGAVILLITGIGSWRVMLATTVGMTLTAFGLNNFGTAIGSTNPMLYLPPIYHFVMGGFAFGMVFMATDPVSCAQTNRGRWLYGLLIGFMCVIIRAINPAYPEGMMLAILFANAFSPLFDYFVIQVNIKKRKRGYA